MRHTPYPLNIPYQTNPSSLQEDTKATHYPSTYATKQARNKSTNSALKTAIKKANIAIETNAADKEELVKVAVKKIDQAAAKGLLHKNNAARKKSALVTKLNKA